MPIQNVPIIILPILPEFPIYEDAFDPLNMLVDVAAPAEPFYINPQADQMLSQNNQYDEIGDENGQSQ